MITADLAREIHAEFVAGSWWPPHRNRPEILMLVVSEVGEASEGYLRDLMDDKLPHLPMLDVELADTAIRLYDVIGCDAIDHVPDLAQLAKASEEELIDLNTYDVQGDLMMIVRHVCHAMEHHRKGRLAEYGAALWRALAAVHTVAIVHGVNLEQCIREKRAFNAVRIDHTLEARSAVGGKAY
jgi:hypothetical protein